MTQQNVNKTTTNKCKGERTMTQQNVNKTINKQTNVKGE